MVFSVGRRFLVSSSLRSDFVEIRRIGPYPDSVIFALLYQYIEHAFECGLRPNVTRFADLVRSLRDEASESLAKLMSAAEDGAELLSSEVFLQQLEEVSKKLQQRERLELNSDFAVIESITAFCTQLNCQCQIRFLVPNSLNLRRMMSVGKFGHCLFLAASTEVFLLYTYFAQESFFMPKCGCLSLKHHAYEDMARLAAGCAVPENRLTEAACRNCETHFSPEDVALVLAAPAVSSYRQLALECCGEISSGISCMNCRGLICSRCAVLWMLTARGPVCRKCKLNFFEHFKSWFPLNAKWTAPYVEVIAKRLNYTHDEQQIAFEEKIRTLPRVVQRVSLPPRPEERAIVKSVGGSIRPGKASLQQQSIESHVCSQCSAAVTHSLCSRGCVCLACAYSLLYQVAELKLMCPLCSEKCENHFDSKKACEECKKEFAMKNLAYFCFRCNCVVCKSCFRRKEGKVKECSDQERPHLFSKGKLEFKKSSDSTLLSSFSLWGFGH